MNNEQIIRKMVDEVWNNHRIEESKNFYDSNLVIMGPQGDIKGIKEFENFLKETFQAFPDLKYTIEELLTINNKVIVRWVGRGTHKGNFLGNAPTNKKISYEGSTIFHLQNNKIKECWVCADLFGLMKQLGLLEAPAR